MFRKNHETSGRRMSRVLAAVLSLAVMASLCAVAAFASEEAPRQELSPADIYEQNVNSTVGITTTITTNIWGYQTQSAAAGSGFIVSDDGYILTNYHVVEDAEDITVAMYDGDTYDAELIGYDSSNDIAVLKVDAQDLDPVTIGDSGALRVGDQVIAIGNPLGELTFSLTGGLISALDREITVSSGVTMDLIQTDCAINAGNSGGALFNMYGEVVGITNAKYSGSGGGASVDNIGFAIPISRVFTIVQSIMTDGVISKPYIGVTVSDVEEQAKAYGVPEGASVRSVVEDGPADKAGIQENDVITAVNGQPITGRSDLSDRVTASAPGDELTLTVYRQGQTVEITVTVGENVTDALPTPTPEPEPAQDRQGSQRQGGEFPFDSFEDFIQQFGMVP